MARPLIQSNVYANPGVGRLSQSYDSQSPLYGGQLQIGSPRNTEIATMDSFSNAAGLTAQVNTITIGTAAIVPYNLAFRIGVGDVIANVTVTPVIGDTAAIIQSKILAALKASKAGSYLNFVSVAATITATARDAGTNGGFDLTASGGGAGFTEVETTPPADPKPMRYGRVIVAVPAEQRAQVLGNPVTPIRSARYAKTAAELVSTIGVTIRDDGHGENFFGGYNQIPAIQPGRPGSFIARGEIVVMNSSVAVAPGGTLHVYLDVPGVDDERVGTLTGAADGALTAPFPATSPIQLYATYGLPVNTPSYLRVSGG
jgi:hypothetical protein